MPGSDELIGQLRGTLGKMELALGAIADAIVWTDEAGNVQWCNGTFDRLVGAPHLRILGRSFRELLPLWREGKQVSSIHELLLTGRASDGSDPYYERRAARGPLYLEAAAVSASLGGELCIVVVLHDVTERKRIEDEIAAKNRELETLLHVASHDLREPLRSIENFSMLVNQEYADRLGDAARDYLRRTVLASARMRRLLEDVLLLARARKIPRPAEEIEGREVVEEAITRLEDAIARVGAAVRVVGRIPRLKADRVWATQAVYNLVANALKFTSGGRPPEVEIGPYPSSGPAIGIRVLDRGPGVDPRDAERIFQLFQRAVGRDVEGTGAGLAIVRAVAERHGGRAWQAPRSGGGSEFVITFGGTP